MGYRWTRNPSPSRLAPSLRHAAKPHISYGSAAGVSVLGSFQREGAIKMSLESGCTAPSRASDHANRARSCSFDAPLGAIFRDADLETRQNIWVI